MKKITKTLALALALALMLPVMPASAASYSDVPADHWAAEEIRAATEAGLFQGRGNGTFGLGAYMSRGAFLIALDRLFGWEDVKPARGSFTDNQNPAAWYFVPVETACANGVLTRQESRCRAGDYITREEMAVMLVRALECDMLAGLVLPSTFKDVTTNSGYIALAQALGITDGYTRYYFGPDDYATREQVAAMLMRVCRRVRGEETEVMGVWTEGGAAGAVDTLLVPCSMTTEGGAYAFSDTVAPTPGQRTLLLVEIDAVQTLWDVAPAAQALAEKAAPYDGAALCLTGYQKADEAVFNAFLRAARDALADKLLYTYIEAPRWGESTWVYDYATLNDLSDRVILRVAPYADATAAIPLCPPEPFEEVFYALRLLEGKVDDDKLALQITTGAQAWYGDAPAEELTAAEVAQKHAQGTPQYYSTRHQSAYLCAPAEELTVWYENSRSVAAKTRLARMMGVNRVCFDDCSGLTESGGLLVG